MSSANAAFEEADINRDGYLSEGEFRNFIARNSTVGNDFNNLGAGSGYGSSAFRSTVYDASTSGGGLGGNQAYSAPGVGGAGYGSSAYESSSYRSSVGNFGGDLANLNVVGTAGISSTDATSFSNMKQMLKEITKILIHKLYDVQLKLDHLLIHKILKFDSFNHQLFPHQE
jgi:hypothetical protein